MPSPSLLYYDPLTQIIEFQLDELRTAVGDNAPLLDFIKIEAIARGADQRIRVIFTNPAEPEPEERMFHYHRAGSLDYVSYWIVYQEGIEKVWSPMNMMKSVRLPYRTPEGEIDFHALHPVFLALGQAILEKQGDLPVP